MARIRRSVSSDGAAVISSLVSSEQTCDFICERCERFFDCQRPEKERIYDRRRMRQAREAMGKIKRIILVAGGKGGVGKSTVTANLSATLAMRGNRVTILDQDLDGSSIPKMFDVMDQRMKMSEEGLLPVDGPLGIQVVATANLPKSEEGLVWFHDMRRNASEEFICHTLYGERDFLVVDLPPGTSSDNVTVIQLLSGADGYVIVTAPSGISQVTARKALLLARKGGMRILGVVENMSGYICEECGEPDDSLPVGGGLALASEQDVPFLGRVPLDPKLAKSCDSGVPLVQAFASSGTARMMDAIVDRVLAQLGDSRQRTFSESELLAPDRPADGPARRG